MDVISQKQLHNDVGMVVRRVEAGEMVTVTVAGRPVAELRPAGRRHWVSGPALAAVWHGPAPRGIDIDLDDLDAALIDPFRP